ncbi:MAG: NAD(P)H-binding protein [Pseudomonadota bacterium]
MPTPHDKTVLLAGATGYIGRHVAAELVDRGYHVVAPVRAAAEGRKPAELEHCDVRVADVTDRASLRAALHDVKAATMVSCVASRNGAPDDARRVDYGANRNLLAMAESLGSSHFVLLSAICVQKPQLAFQHAKLAFERELVDSDIDYSIVRPTAFFKSISGQVARVRSGKPFLVFGRGTETACKPISERDLARYLVDCIEQPSRRNHILPIGGPGEAITPLDQGTLLFELAGKPTRFRRIPVVMFDVAIGVLSALARLFPSLAAKAEFARIGRYYATESMLTWNADESRYDADATPSYGSDRLRQHYEAQLSDTGGDDALGEHKLF